MMRTQWTWGRCTAVMMALGCACPCVGGGGGDDDPMPAVEGAIRASFKAEAEGRLGDALRAVDDGAEVPPRIAQHPIMRYRAGKVLMQQRLWAAALAAFCAACQGDPEQPGLFSHAAFALRMLGETAAARRALRAARALDGQDQWLAPQLIHLQRHSGISLLPPERRAVERRAPGGEDVRRGDLAIVTAANSIYFGCVANFVGSAQRHAPDVPILLYDIGLNDMERDSARTWAGVTVKQLDWSSYGAHVTDVRIKAWKPFAIQHALTLFPAIVYQDAGQEIRHRIDGVTALLHRDGYFFVIQQEKSLPALVHPGMLQSLAVDPFMVKGYDMCAAGILALANTSTAARQVVDYMVDCAARRACIAPDGATQLSHRYEQAVLSVALAMRNIRCHNSWKFYAYLEHPQDAGTHEKKSCPAATCLHGNTSCCASPSLLLPDRSHDNTHSCA
jgi:hypothetical protein